MVQYTLTPDYRRARWLLRAVSDLPYIILDAKSTRGRYFKEKPILLRMEFPTVEFTAVLDS